MNIFQHNYFFGFILSIFCLINFRANAEASDSLATENDKVLVYKISLTQEIMPAAWRLIKDAVQEAEDADADYIYLLLNTYGGRVDIADSIRTRLLRAKPIVLVHIKNNAASAGALISIACDSIYMVEGASIGAATVVDQTGAQAPDKYQSYMRSTMRSTAEAQNRDPDIAEAMVDDRKVIEGVIEEGKVLTFTTSEAIANNFCDGQAESFEDVMKLAKVENYEVKTHELTTTDRIIAFLLNPLVSSIIMLMIFGGIYFELQSPGIGFPIAAALIGATLYFAPLYLEGLAANWEILLFIVGIILIAVELFVIPGFGIAGIGGILFVVAGLTLSLVHNDFFDFSFGGIPNLSMAFARVMFTLGIGIIAMLIFGKSIFSTPAFQKIILSEDQKSEEGFSIKQIDLDLLIGNIGVAITDLRPSGKVEIEDRIYDAISEASFISRNDKVKVLKTEGYSIIVRKV